MCAAPSPLDLSASPALVPGVDDQVIGGLADPSCAACASSGSSASISLQLAMAASGAPWYDNPVSVPAFLSRHTVLTGGDGVCLIRSNQLACSNTQVSRTLAARKFGKVRAMCGIVGYAGARPALDIVLDGLRRLEYRGYDSAGVADRRRRRSC